MPSLFCSSIGIRMVNFLAYFGCPPTACCRNFSEEQVLSILLARTH